MSAEEFQRKLTAILSADVQGYSRLMGDDEDSTVRTLTAYRSLMISLIQKHRGHVVDTPGDNLLAKFGSVMNAVRCAVEIQEELRIRNIELPENRKMQFRIGINLGDVIEEGDHIYGDGINVAARIEAMADGGGICVSGTVYDSIRNKLSMSYESLGEHNVKNIKNPVRVYKIKMAPEPAKAVVKEKKAGLGAWQRASFLVATTIILGVVAVWYLTFRQTPTPTDVEETLKTIAVLPFSDLSPKKDQEYFADGMAEELINKLSRVKDLQVTSRTSSFYFKGKNIDMRTIGDTLSVAYLLEGSVRKSGNQLRITAQLIKAVDGYHLFSKTYDRELKDIFFIQDDIAKAVTTALSVTLGVGEFRRPGMTRNIEAYDEFLRAGANLSKYTPDSMLDAISQAKMALDIDPEFGLAWRQLAEAYLFGSTVLPPGGTGDFTEKGNEALQHARDLAPEMPELQLDTASEYQKNGNYLEAERIYRNMLDEQLFSVASVSGSYGRVLICVGRISDALSHLQRAKRLNPMDADVSFYLSLALLHLKRVDEALVEASRGQKLEGLGTVFSHIELAAALESNDKPKAAAILNTNYRLEGDYPDETMLRLAKILLKEDKEAVLSELKDLSKESDVSPMTMMALAFVASGEGDPELAFNLYLESEFFDVPTAIWSTLNRGIRQLPAFKNWARKIGLYDYWRDSGEWGDFCRPVGDDGFVCD